MEDSDQEPEPMETETEVVNPPTSKSVPIAHEVAASHKELLEKGMQVPLVRERLMCKWDRVDPDIPSKIDQDIEEVMQGEGPLGNQLRSLNCLFHAGAKVAIAASKGVTVEAEDQTLLVDEDDPHVLESP